MASARPSQSSTGKCTQDAWRCAIASSSRDGSRPSKQVDLARIERQIQPRPDTDLENAPARPGDQLLAQRHQLLLAHAEVNQARQDPALIEGQLTSTARGRSNLRRLPTLR